MIRYVDIGGRTKLAIQDRISDYIPNPTFNRVAVPGGAGYDVTKGGGGFTIGDVPASGRWSRCRASTRSSIRSRASS